jgi:hypothetical protein
LGASGLEKGFYDLRLLHRGRDQQKFPFHPFAPIGSASLFRLRGRLLAAAKLQQPRDETPEPDFPLPEIILVWGFALYPALIAVITKLIGGGDAFRYGWPGILGLVLGLVYLVRSIWHKPSCGYLLAVLLIAFAVQDGNALRMACTAGAIRVVEGSEAQFIYMPGSTRMDERWVNLAELSRSERSLPVAIGSQVAYLEAAEYSPPELRDRLVDVVDPDMALRLLRTDTGDKNNRILAQFIPMRVEDLVTFQAAHDRFILFSGCIGDWFTPYLLKSGYHLRLLSTDVNGQKRLEPGEVDKRFVRIGGMIADVKGSQTYIVER